LLALPLQAQTVANFFLAFEQELAIVPVLNKIDMESAEPQVCCVTIPAVHGTSGLLASRKPACLLACCGSATGDD
jgi:translation elongation factor EF-4